MAAELAIPFVRFYPVHGLASRVFEVRDLKWHLCRVVPHHLASPGIFDVDPRTRIVIRTDLGIDAEEATRQFVQELVVVTLPVDLALAAMSLAVGHELRERAKVLEAVRALGPVETVGSHDMLAQARDIVIVATAQMLAYRLHEPTHLLLTRKEMDRNTSGSPC